MVKKARYEEIGEEVSASTAFIQAAHALDIAGSIAEENRDTESLLQIAQTYVAIAERLIPHQHEDEEEYEEGDTPFGFGVSAVSSTLIEVEEDEEMEEEHGDESEV